MKKLERLFSPINIGTMEVKNRIVLSPMHTDYGANDGTVSDRLLDYHVARARGGVGLLTLEMTTVSEFEPYMPKTIGMWHDKFLPGLRELTQAVHEHGAKIIPQMAHPGPESLAPYFHGTETKGPSPVMCHTTKKICQEMSLKDIEAVVVEFGEGARRAREAGFDGIELHAAHSYMLVGSFLSGLRNRRSDRYGGSIEARLQLPLEIIQCIRERAGEDFPIVMRISGDEYMPGGRTLRETQFIAPILADAGITAFHVSAGVYPHGSWRVMPPTGTPLGINVGLSAGIKKVVDVPVMTVGRINDPLFAEDVLRNEEADMVVMGRALITDPDLPNKALEGRFEDIAPCIGCGQGCIGRKPHAPMTCLVNPTVGKEREMAIVAAAQPRKVMIVGGGPGGLEAARVAALRGHEVHVYEQQEKVGGAFNLAAIAPRKHELGKLIHYQVVQIEKAGGTIHLNTQVTPELVAEAAPDVVILATGGEPVKPPIPGISADHVYMAHDILAGTVRQPSGNILVIGGGLVGCEVAETLANLGDNPVIDRTTITIVEMLDQFGAEMIVEIRTLTLHDFRELGIDVLTSTKVKEILADGVLVEDKRGRERTLEDIDSVIVAIGTRPYEILSDKIRDTVAEVHVIGDAKQARSALESIQEGADIARMI
jgi:2,4-dienoyl-CoA reductase-like NADH-dependent reductase (Old Yellow Enzyme family)/thioredoxin reductase